MVHCILAHPSSHESVVKTAHLLTFCYQQTKRMLISKPVVPSCLSVSGCQLALLQPAGLVAAEAAHSTGCSGPMLNAAAFCAGVTRPISTAICLGISTLLRKKLQRH